VWVPNELAGLTAFFAEHGFLAAEEEAEELLACAGGDTGRLDALVGRRLSGEPLAWITGATLFCGLQLAVDPGVYVPRWQSEQLARRAVERLPATGTAIDLCTGSGAIAKVLTVERPEARVLACDVDERAVACAAANGVDVYLGDLFAALPSGLKGNIDLIVAVVPYVPTGELGLLQRDTFAFESTLAYDGGADGTDVLRRVISDGRHYLRERGALLLEVGGEQGARVSRELARLGYSELRVLRDEDGDVRGIEATAPTRARAAAGVNDRGMDAG
jgi:release factor glutamine methyltransferase